MTTIAIIIQLNFITKITSPSFLFMNQSQVLST